MADAVALFWAYWPWAFGGASLFCSYWGYKLWFVIIPESEWQRDLALKRKEIFDNLIKKGVAPEDILWIESGDNSYHYMYPSQSIQGVGEVIHIMELDPESFNEIRLGESLCFHSHDQARRYMHALDRRSIQSVMDAFDQRVQRMEAFSGTENEITPKRFQELITDRRFFPNQGNKGAGMADGAVVVPLHGNRTRT